jgi:muconolactone delta-isomerase
MQFISILRRRTEEFSDEEFAPLLEPEAEAVRKLYAHGIVRNIWSRDDKLGAVTLIEADSLIEAREIVDSFPLAQRGMLELEALIPLRGYRGFGPRSK